MNLAASTIAVLSAMESKIGHARFAYTILYVKDVAKAAEFYKNAFGFPVRRIDHSRRWAELDTGHTTLAFTPMEQRETAITGGVQSASKDEPRVNIELCFTYDDVEAAYKHAVQTGALRIASPEQKEWGQKVGYVRDLDGIMIRLGSPVQGN